MVAPHTESDAGSNVQPAIRCVDCDIHQSVGLKALLPHLSQPWKSMAERGTMAGHLGLYNPGGVTRADAVLEDGRHGASCPEGIARCLLDPYGIDIGILTGGLYGMGIHPDPDYAAAVCAAYNDYMLAEWLPRDGRFRLAIAVAPQDPALAAREIERVGGHPRVVEVIMSSAATAPLGQRQYHPVYAAAERMGLPVAIHPGQEGCGISARPTAAGMPTRYLEWHTGLSATFQAHVISLVCEGVFQKFPRLRFVLTEGGVSWLVPLMWRFDKNWKALRSTVPWLDRPPSAVIQEHFYLTTQPIEEPEDHAHLRQLFGMFDAEHMLLYSSDFPHWDGDTPAFAVHGLPASFKRRVLAENAIELFGAHKLAPAPAPAPAQAGSLVAAGGALLEIE